MAKKSSSKKISSNTLFRSSKSIPSSNTLSPQIIQIQQKQGFFSDLLQGFGLGAGQAIAHNIFRSDSTINHVHTSSQIHISKEYEQCMKETYNDEESCKQFLEKK